MKYLLTIISLFATIVLAAAPANSPTNNPANKSTNKSVSTNYSVSGKVVDDKTGEALAGVVVFIDELWAISDDNGNFVFDKVAAGKYNFAASLLGYVDYKTEIEVTKELNLSPIRLKESTLQLEDVVVTASIASSRTGTTRNIGRDALNHLQLSSMTDMAALMPGGKTSNPDLTSQSSFNIRGAGTNVGNAAFSTAVEVDGVRMGNNASMGAMSGVDTRSIAVDNVESVEVISGVPSVEYGDLGSGIVIIHTKKGRSPLNINFSVNPRTYQASVSKGIEFSKNAGVLNVSAEWANATKKLTSPYESYTRRGLNLNYSNTFAKVLRFELGLAGNLGGMDTKDDPDAFVGEYTKVRDNSLRANTSLLWQINNNFITSLRLEGSFKLSDNLSHEHTYHSNASKLPAVYSEEKGYYLAHLLPSGTYFSDRMDDSKDMDYGFSLKYLLNRRFGEYKSNLKAGVQFRSNGNLGTGEYYLDPELAANGYRPRPYSIYPFMNTLSLYAEESFTFPFGLELTAGIRSDMVSVKGSQYKNLNSISPRFNAKWKINNNLSLRAAWGISEKLPSFFILYPKQEYLDILTESRPNEYYYYTYPYTIQYNPNLKWQRNENSEVALDANFWGVKLSLVGFYNITHNPYEFNNGYSQLAFKKVNDKGIKIDDRTFVNSKVQDNGAPIYRSGLELTADFPEIQAIKTSFRLDASYSQSYLSDSGDYYYYNQGWSHTSIANRRYQYVGVYPNGGNNNLMIKGKKTSSLDLNLTSITHIPEARLILTCRLEASLFSRSINIPTGSTEVLYPDYFLDVEDEFPTLHPFTDAQKSLPEFAALAIRPSNDALFLQDGYGAYASANISVTKEIGDHISLSFFANNFTNSRPYVVSMATGVGAIFTPAFYYGLSCRIKL